MESFPELCIGSVQFGMPYGITNKSGKVGNKEIRKILIQCKNYGIESIDTAQAYGDAEKILGDNSDLTKNMKFKAKSSQ